jgi:hypothetical protein
MKPTGGGIFGGLRVGTGTWILQLYIFNYEILHPLQEFLTVNDHNLEGSQIREGSNPKMEIWIPGVKYIVIKSFK